MSILLLKFDIKVVKVDLKLFFYFFQIFISKIFLLVFMLYFHLRIYKMYKTLKLIGLVSFVNKYFNFLIIKWYLEIFKLFLSFALRFKSLIIFY